MTVNEIDSKIHSLILEVDSLIRNLPSDDSRRIMLIVQELVELKVEKFRLLGII